MRKPRPLLLWARTAFCVSILALAGCGSTPQASREQDAEAKRFEVHSDAATIYVYRDDFRVDDFDMQDTTLFVDARLIGATLPKAFFRFYVRAGGHLLHGAGYDNGRLKLETRSGELYFVSLHVVGGTSNFALVSPETGKREILRCCALMENWARGQRPFVD